MNKKIFAAALAGILLLGANLAVAEETKTVAWYLAPENEKALDAKIKECKDNPGELWDTPNCVNARHAAEKKIMGGSFKKVKEPAIPTF